MLNSVVLIIEIVSTIGVMLIEEFVPTIVVLVAGIMFIKGALIIFKDIVVVLIIRFVLVKVLFVVGVIKAN